MILPLYRLAFTNYALYNEEDKIIFKKSIRRTYKKFMTWPINTSNRIIEASLGNLD